MKRRKSWTDKFEAPAEPIVKPCPVAIAGMRPGQMMLIPTPKLIDAFIRSLPPGRSVSVKEMREGLARQHGAETTCPINTGFHLRTVAEAAMERAAGHPPETPFWRVIDETSPVFAKLSFDIDIIRHHRRLEGMPPRA
jgi:hypothetical protein